MWYREQILKAGKKLAALDPDNVALIGARRWWKYGTTYSNQDFDVLQSLESAIWRIEKQS